MPVVLATLLPDFLLIALGGWLVRRTGRDLWRGIDRLNFDILLPSLLFLAAARRPVAIGDLGTLAAALAALMLLGLAAGWPARPTAGPQAALDFAGQWQTCWRFSSPLAFVAVAPFGARAGDLMGVAVGAGVSMANLLAVMVLSRGRGLGLAATALRVMGNPFFLASLGGLAVGLSGIHLPGPLLSLLERLASAAIPMALLSMGAAIDWRMLHRPGAREVWLAAVKLLLLPAAALAGGWLFGLDPDQRAVLLLLAALPTASSAHILAGVFGADPQPTAMLIAQGTIAATVTLPLWMTVALGL